MSRKQLGLFCGDSPGDDGVAALSGGGQPSRLVLQGSELWYDPSFFAPDEADALLKELEATVPFRVDSIVIFGKRHLLPRQTAWFGDEGCTYKYSGIRMSPARWTPAIERIRAKVEARAGARFNSVLLNRYRDGADKVDWHSDDEPDLGPAPVVASVSFGGVRTFKLRWKDPEERARHKEEGSPRDLRFELAHGSLLLMAGETQRFWEHQVPATAKLVPPRINLTFRRILP